MCVFNTLAVFGTFMSCLTSSLRLGDPWPRKTLKVPRSDHGMGPRLESMIKKIWMPNESVQALHQPFYKTNALKCIESLLSESTSACVLGLLQAPKSLSGREKKHFHLITFYVIEGDFFAVPLCRLRESARA